MVREAKIVVTGRFSHEKKEEKETDAIPNIRLEISKGNLSILSYVFQCALTCVVPLMNYTRL